MNLLIVLSAALSTMFTVPVRASTTGEVAAAVPAIETVTATSQTANPVGGSDLFTESTENAVATTQGDADEVATQQSDAMDEEYTEQEVSQGYVEEESGDEEDAAPAIDFAAPTGGFSNGAITEPEKSFSVESTIPEPFSAPAPIENPIVPSVTTFSNEGSVVGGQASLPFNETVQPAPLSSFSIAEASDDDDDDEVVFEKEIDFDDYEEQIKKMQETLDPKLLEEIEKSGLAELLAGMQERGESLEDQVENLAEKKEELVRITAKMSKAFGDFGGFIADRSGKSTDTASQKPSKETEKPVSQDVQNSPEIGSYPQSGVGG